MTFPNPFRHFALGDLFDTVLPDFILAFAFFTSVVYAVLSRRFGEQRPAVAMSAALGGALSIGLVWWEYQNGLTIRNLGPIAVGFAIIILGGVMYQSIKGIGGSWAGAGIAIGVSLLIGRLLELPWPMDWEMMQTIVIVSLVVGVIAFLLRHHGGAIRIPTISREGRDYRHDARDLYRDRHVGKKLSRGFKQVRKRAEHFHEHPEGAQDVMSQLKRMLPAEGWLTERMARLREKAHYVCKGHIARIKEIRGQMAKLPPEGKRKASQELAARYQELKLDQRLERLDQAVTENERRIRELTRQAQAYVNANDHKALTGVLDQANKLQRHNEKLFKLIDGTETRLMAITRQLMKQSPEVKLA